MLDALSDLDSDHSQRAITDRVLLAEKPETHMAERYLLHVAGKDEPPCEVSNLQSMQNFCNFANEFSFFLFPLCVCVFAVVVVVTVMMVLTVMVMMVLAVVVMIVLVVVVDGVGIRCGSVGDCVLFPFISYVFKSSFYFNQFCNMAIDKTNKNSKPSYIVCIHAVHCIIV